MKNAYVSPERIAAYMQHIADNFDRIKELRAQMLDTESPLETRVLAFVDLYRLYDGDPFQQKRLLNNLEGQLR